MHLPSELLKELGNPDLSLSDRARLSCQLAQRYEQVGDYTAASEALGEFWKGVGVRPDLEGLHDADKAEVLLRVGALTGWIGSARQIEGAQEAAKDLIGESLRLLQRRGMRSKAGAAQSDLALCYWREGAYDEARIMLQEAYRDIDKRNIEQRAITLIRQAFVERETNRLHEALRFHHEAKPLFDEIDNHLLTAHFHHEFANVLNRLSSAEDRRDYVDLALIEYTAASFHFGEAGHERFQACVENNIGHLLGSIGRFPEAHHHLDRAQVLMTQLKDNVHLAQVDETRATILLAEGRNNVEAEKTARSAVRKLENGDELSLLAEALTTHGIALARLKHPDQAREALDRAIKVAEQVGDFEKAGIAALTIIEQLGRTLSIEDICEVIDHAGMLLKKTQNIDTLRRLASAAFDGLFLAQAAPAPPIWSDFSLRQAVRQYERKLIKRALEESGGSVTRAAHLLGFKKHQGLVYLINNRHKDELVNVRLPVVKRRKNILKHPKRKKKESGK
jgi:tetratricopeptide (TPR) repeat protein